MLRQVEKHSGEIDIHTKTTVIVNEKEVMFLLVLYYFNWAGTPEEFKEFAGAMMSKTGGVESVEPLGVFAPSSEWNYVAVMKTPSYEKALQTFKAHIEKNGRPKTSLGKIELFHTFEELGYQ